MSTKHILVLGGTGTVGRRIVHRLCTLDNNIPVLSASRSGSEPTAPPDNPTKRKPIPVTFDWHDATTWSNIFNAAGGPGNISAAHLIAPPTLDSGPLMMDFVDFARERGVRRFVLQSASSIEAGGPAMGKVHAYLRELGQRGEADWAVLRPSWFQQNFAEQPSLATSIKKESKIYSAAGDGKIPFVSADDIAAVAVHALTTPEPPNTEFLVLGPELLSYYDIAETLSQILGRKIVHVDVSPEELEKRHEAAGIPGDYARALSSMDTSIKFGAENRTNDVIFSVTGVAPRRFREYAEGMKEVWWEPTRKVEELVAAG